MRSGKTLALAALLALIGTVGLLAGCSQDGNEYQRLVCEVSQVNEGAPLVSGYLDVGADKEAGTENQEAAVQRVVDGHDRISSPRAATGHPRPAQYRPSRPGAAMMPTTRLRFARSAAGGRGPHGRRQQ